MSHMCETNNNCLHLTIVITTTERFSPSRNLQLRQLDFGIYNAFQR